jgi:RecJ-like exonuclease
MDKWHHERKCEQCNTWTSEVDGCAKMEDAPDDPRFQLMTCNKCGHISRWDCRGMLPTLVRKSNLEIKSLNNKTCIMPRELTAENGAKKLLSGEFKEHIMVPCGECSGIGHDPEFFTCETCNGIGDVDQTMYISWTTIKEIYKMAVKHLEIQ